MRQAISRIFCSMYSLHHYVLCPSPPFRSWGTLGEVVAICAVQFIIFNNFQFSTEPLLCASLSIPNVHRSCCACIELKECLTVIGRLLVLGLSACKKLKEVMAGFSSCMLLIVLSGGEGNLYNMCADMCRDESPSHY